ncbi:hypothetical protein DL98DRAFT_538929 [Cadophora sp. DSE1049]|nr:hypothetical protein DL98DRAFT_538929 [Cadophora sp. DSE1049]
MSAKSTQDSDVMYDINKRQQGGWLITEKSGPKRLTPTERGDKSKKVPDELYRPHMATSEVLKQVSYHSLDDFEPVYLKAKTKTVSRDMPVAMVMSTQKIAELGHLERLARLQSLLVDPETKPYMKSLERVGHVRRKGTTHNLTWSVQATHDTGSIQPGAIAKAQSPKVMEIVELVTTIGSDLVKAFPGAWTAEHEKQWIKEASLTCGVDSNKSITSIQVNYSTINDKTVEASDESAGLQDSLKDTAHVHDDGGDERRSHSVLFFLSTVCVRAREIHDNAYGPEGLGAFLTKKNQNTQRMLMAIKGHTDISVDNPSPEDYVRAFGWEDDAGDKQYPDLEIAKKGIFYREEDDDTQWDLMKKFANYNNAHLTKDEPTRYGYCKARLAKFEAKEAAGDSWYCDYIKSDGKKCKTAKVKVEGATKCHQHLSKENPAVEDDDDWEAIHGEEEEGEAPDTLSELIEPTDMKRSREEDSEGESSKKRRRLIKTKCTGKKSNGENCTYQAQWGTDKCGFHAKTS